MKRQSWGLVCLAAMVVSASALAQAPAPATAASKAATSPAAGQAMTMQATPGEETGLAAVYSDKLAGHRTASGKRYNPHQLTAAHRTLPFGTRVLVTNVKNGKSVELRITDRGPKQANRILDISPRAAHALGIRKTAMAEVKLSPVSAAQ